MRRQTKRVSKTKKAITSSKKTLSWSDQGLEALKAYTKSHMKKGSSSAAIAVLSSTGELVCSHGAWRSVDWTSVGSLVSAWRATVEALNAVLKVTSKHMIAGENKTYWLAWDDQKWVVLGLNMTYSAKGLKTVFAWLKKSSRSQTPRRDLSVELSGLTSEGLDSVLKKGLL